MSSDQLMLETMQEIGGLLFRRHTGELNIHEQIALDNWLKEQDPDSRQFFEDCSDPDQINEALSSMYEFNEKAALADIQKKIQLGTQPVAPAVEIVELRRGWRVYLIAAAVLLVAVGVTVIFNWNRRNSNIAELPIEQRYHNDVSPGGNKAILELADGSKIVLDNASNGELAKQGSTQVIKLDNGQLAYHSGQAGAATVSYNTISTPSGGQYQVILPDGSKVWLNALSSLRFPTAFTGAERKVELNGEAYFEVARDESQPFIVHKENMAIRVLGTHFNVRAYNDESVQSTTLLEGSVEVTDGVHKARLSPGDRAAVRAREPVRVEHGVDVDEVISWKNGYFHFEGEDLPEVMIQLARWYDVSVEYRGNFRVQKITGKIERNLPLSAVLQGLENPEVHFKIQGKKVVVTP